MTDTSGKLPALTKGARNAGANHGHNPGKLGIAPHLPQVQRGSMCKVSSEGAAGSRSEPLRSSRAAHGQAFGHCHSDSNLKAQKRLSITTQRSVYSKAREALKMDTERDADKGNRAKRVTFQAAAKATCKGVRQTIMGRHWVSVFKSFSKNERNMEMLKFEVTKLEKEAKLKWRDKAKHVMWLTSVIREVERPGHVFHGEETEAATGQQLEVEMRETLGKLQSLHELYSPVLKEMQTSTEADEMILEVNPEMLALTADIQASLTGIGESMSKLTEGMEDVGGEVAQELTEHQDEGPEFPVAVVSRASGSSAAKFWRKAAIVFTFDKLVLGGLNQLLKEAVNDVRVAAAGSGHEQPIALSLPEIPEATELTFAQVVLDGADRISKRKLYEAEQGSGVAQRRGRPHAHFQAEGPSGFFGALPNGEKAQLEGLEGKLGHFPRLDLSSAPRRRAAAGSTNQELEGAQEPQQESVQLPIFCGAAFDLWAASSLIKLPGTPSIDWDCSIYESLNPTAGDTQRFPSCPLMPHIYHSIGPRIVNVAPSLHESLTQFPYVDQRLQCPFAFATLSHPLTTNGGAQFHSHGRPKRQPTGRMAHRKIKYPDSPRTLEQVLGDRKLRGLRFAEESEEVEHIL